MATSIPTANGISTCTMSFSFKRVTSFRKEMVIF